MEDFKEQYNRELIYQEIKSNKYTLKGFFWFIVCLAFVWLLTVTGFFEVDKKFVTIVLLSIMLMFIPPLYIFCETDLSALWIKYFLLSLICVATAVIISFLSYHAVLIYVIPLLFAVQYRRRSTIWFVFIVNIIAMLVSSFASFYFGLCDLNLLLESQHTRSWYMSMVTDGVLNIPFNDNVPFIIVVFEVFPRCIMLFVFSVMMQYAVVSSNEDAMRIAQLTYLKETDVKTRVFNKNKYEEMVSAYYPKVERIAVIFWDLNNLKFINDKYGHAMGDKAIEKLSSALYEYSNDLRRVYRIGGDEFVMVIDNPNDEEVENIVKSVKVSLDKDCTNDDVRISSAVGFAFGSGNEILKVLEEADAKMYENKKLCKENRN